MNKIGVYAGSFNPFHKGHLSIVRRASLLFDKVIIYVSQNATKTGVGCKASIERCILPDNVEVDFLPNRIYLVSYVESQFPDDRIYLIRGIRNGHDADYEIEMKHINSQISDSIETVIFPPMLEYSSMSSSTIRNLIGYDRWENVVNEYLPRQIFNGVLKNEIENDSRNPFYIRWRKLMEKFEGPDFEIHFNLVDILSKYSDKKRYYHGLIHLSHSFSAFDKHLSEIEGSDALELAIFYHDYYNDGDDPERRSADVMRKYLAGKYPGEILDNAYTIIMATASHFTRAIFDYTPAQKWMMDIDLVDLASDWEDFEGINDMKRGEIWREYKAHHPDVDAPDEVYREKRKEYLGILLSYPKIYQSEQFECYESKARSNINRWVNE